MMLDEELMFIFCLVYVLIGFVVPILQTLGLIADNSIESKIDELEKMVDMKTLETSAINKLPI